MATANGEMHIDAGRAQQLSANLTSIGSRIRTAAGENKGSLPRLVAVSKLKPANDILALYQNHQHLHFGENYQQELQQKAQLLPAEIRWHFIGGLQTNKCKPLAEQVSNLWCVESVDTVKKADQLNKGREALCAKHSQITAPLRIFVQVNTSGESEKSGVEPSQATALCKHVLAECKHLKLQGLMTIGAIARSQAAGSEAGQENEDFIALREVRSQVAGDLGMPETELELSMGMSNDFESAIRCGSDEVRVGSTIFGERPAKQDAKITD